MLRQMFGQHGCQFGEIHVGRQADRVDISQGTSNARCIPSDEDARVLNNPVVSIPDAIAPIG